MPTYKCRIYNRFRSGNNPTVYSNELYSGETTAVSPQEAENNMWYRAAVDKKWINPKRHSKIILRTKLSRFIDYYKGFDYKCECVEIDPKTRQGVLSFEYKIGCKVNLMCELVSKRFNESLIGDNDVLTV